MFSNSCFYLFSYLHSKIFRTHLTKSLTLLFESLIFRGNKTKLNQIHSKSINFVAKPLGDTINCGPQLNLNNLCFENSPFFAKITFNSMTNSMRWVDVVCIDTISIRNR